MVFSGSETDQVEILLLANRAGAPGDLQLHVGFQRDLLHAEGVRATLRGAGIEIGATGEVTTPERVGASIIKAGINPDASLRGGRTKRKTTHIKQKKTERG